MNWDDLRFFLAVAGAGSLSGAGQQLGVNTTTVLRRVASLEDDLGAVGNGQAGARRFHHAAAAATQQTGKLVF